MIELMIFNIRELSSEEIFAYWLNQMDKERAGKVTQCKNRDDRLQSLAAGMIVKSFQDSHHMKKISGYRLSDGEKIIYYSISHSGDYAAVAFSDKSVGMDLQEMRPVRYLQLSKRFFTVSQNEAICDLKNKEQQLSLFYQYWTEKEAEIKYSEETVGDFMHVPVIKGYACSIAVKERQERECQIPIWKLYLNPSGQETCFLGKEELILGDIVEKKSGK